MDIKRLEEFGRRSGWFPLESRSGSFFDTKSFITPTGSIVVAVKKKTGGDWRVISV